MDGNNERSARGATVEAGENDAKRAKMMQDSVHAADQVGVVGESAERNTLREDRVRKRSKTRNIAREKEQSRRGRERREERKGENEKRAKGEMKRRRTTSGTD
jgi:hypothetical protein